MKWILVVAGVGAVALYWQGSKRAAPGSDVGAVLQAGLASISWPTPHAGGKKPCCKGCADAAGTAQPMTPQPIELVAS